MFKYLLIYLLGILYKVICKDYFKLQQCLFYMFEWGYNLVVLFRCIILYRFIM